MPVRTETPADYAGIANLHAEAFDSSAPTAAIVALHRATPRFDPDLSLVAEEDGRIAGHVLFSPHTVRFLGEEIDAVNLSPIAVLPSLQNKGIGSLLVRAGHEAARSKGYKLSFLIGHPPYYPRFGYKQHAYGRWSVTLPTGTVGTEQPDALEVRPPRSEDVPALRQLWVREFGGVDFALDPGGTLLDWLSPNSRVESLVYVADGRIAGYTRASIDKPGEARVFIAGDDRSARAIAAHIHAKASSAGVPEPQIVLPLHPFSASVAAFGVEPQSRATGAAMACPLSPSPFDEYYARVQRGEHPVGQLIWPPIFDL